MQQSQPSAASQSFTTTSRKSSSIFIQRYIVFVISFGILFLFITALALLPINRTAGNIQPDSKYLNTQNAATVLSSPANTNPSSVGQVTNSTTADTEPPPSADNTTQVTVNGQSIPVPPEGSTSHTITNGNDQTTVSVTNQSSSAQGSSGSSSSNNFSVSVNSSSN